MSYIAHQYQDIPSTRQMDYCLLYQKEDGSLAILNPSPKYQQPGELDLDAIGRLHAQYLPDILAFIAIKRNKLPADPCFRDAWELGDQNEPIKINLGKCLKVHRQRLQAAADSKIAGLAKELKAAYDKANTPAQVAIQRTIAALSGIGEMNLSHCKTAEELKIAIPKELYDVWNFYPVG